MTHGGAAVGRTGEAGGGIAGAKGGATVSAGAIGGSGIGGATGIAAEDASGAAAAVGLA